jgi:hypothetical protein
MKKVYQEIISSDNGDCMRACVASLFELDLYDVPHFLEQEKWYHSFHGFFKEKGFDLCGDLYNRNYSRLCNPTHELFKKEKFHEPSMLNKRNLLKYESIGGFYMATVFSPKYFNLRDGFTNTHAVIIDENFNIVHDPNPNYKGIVRYPLQEILGKNGIIMVDKLKKI